MAQQKIRERNKQEKLERIREAAQQLFEEKGFEATTTFAVAERAQIGTGTLFLYVKDKQELVLLVYHQALDETIERAFASLPSELPLLEKLLHIFEHFFRLYSHNLEISRIYIKELLFHTGYRKQVAEQINFFLKRLIECLELAQAQGELAQEIDLAQTTANFFALYYSVLTMWLSGVISLEEAVNQHLRNAFALQIRGLLPRL